MKNLGINKNLENYLNKLVCAISELKNITSTPLLNIISAVGTSDPLANGQSSIITIPVAGVTSTNLVAISISNADSFPANVFVTSKELYSDGVIQVVLKNESGNNILAQDINLSVITF